MTRNIKELKKARRLVTQAHRVQKRLKLTNRQFVELVRSHGGMLSLRTYGNWLTKGGNLPRESAFPSLKIAIALDPSVAAEPAQSITQPQASVETTAVPEPVPA